MKTSILEHENASVPTYFCTRVFPKSLKYNKLKICNIFTNILGHAFARAFSLRLGSFEIMSSGRAYPAASKSTFLLGKKYHEN